MYVQIIKHFALSISNSKVNRSTRCARVIQLKCSRCQVQTEVELHVFLHVLHQQKHADCVSL